MSEIAKLKKEIKRLKALLNNAVELLHKSKELLVSPVKPASRKKPLTAKRKRRTAASA